MDIKSKTLGLASLLLSVSAMAQDGGADSVSTKDNLEQRIYSLPYYSYGKGLGFTSPDSVYQMNIRFRIQSRGSFVSDEDGEYSIDGQVRRLRLRLDGYVGNPRFTYALQLSFAPGDLGGSLKEGQNINIIRDAVVFYSITKNWSVGFGQTKLPGNRQRVNSSGALQLSDRSINNASFNLDRDFGLHTTYIYQRRNKFSYAFKGAISQGEGRNFTENDDLHLAYTGKVELYPFGSFKKNGQYFEGDILYEERPRLMLSGAYQFNSKAKRNSGQQGETLYEAKDQHAIFADLIFKYRGWSFMTAYMQRYSDNPIAINPDRPGDYNYVMAGHGYDIQSSYMLPRSYELIARYSGQKMQEEIATFKPNAEQYTLGLTKYIWEHAFKFQLEGTYNKYKFLNDSQTDNWYVRFQVEMGI